MSGTTGGNMSGTTDGNAGFALADGGIETALVDRLGQELPEFSAFVLLGTAPGRAALADYFRPFLELAERERLPLVLDTPTWRANPDWIRRLGRDPAELGRANASAVELVRDLARELAPSVPVRVNGCVGPRFDDDAAGERMSAAQAQAYHAPQVGALAAAGADSVTAVTMSDAPEAIGVVRAAADAGVPVSVSFTVGTDGRLPDGSTLETAIAVVDAATGGAAAGFLVNCAHPDEARAALDAGGPVPPASSAAPAAAAAAPTPAAPELAAARPAAPLRRLRGFRLNAARHGDDGPGDSPSEFAAAILALGSRLAADAEGETDDAPEQIVLGGCCGTDVPHIAAVATGLARSE